MPILSVSREMRPMIEAALPPEHHVIAIKRRDDMPIDELLVSGPMLDELAADAVVTLTCRQVVEGDVARRFICWSHRPAGEWEIEPRPFVPWQGGKRYDD